MKIIGNKRISAALLALSLALTVVPKPVFAEGEAEATLCPCCNQAAEWIEVNSQTENSFAQAGHYRLTENVTIPETYISVGYNMTLDLNGFHIYTPDNYRAFGIREGYTLNIVDLSQEANGAIIGKPGPTAVGGVIYTKGTLNLYSGRIVGTSLPANGGTIYIDKAGTMNMYGGTVEGGMVTAEKKHGGNIAVSGTLNMYDGLIIGGQADGYQGYGGNIYVTGKFNMYGGTVEDGTSHNYGGNLFVSGYSEVNLFGGNIINGGCVPGVRADGTSYVGNGGNIYVTNPTSKLRIIGTTISGGYIEGTNYGGNLMINTGAHVYMYGGVIKDGSAKTGANVCVGSSKELSDGTVQQSSFFMLGGTIIAGSNNQKDMYRRSTKNVIAFYNGRYTGTNSQVARKAECACYMPDDAGITFWHKGNCEDCAFVNAVAENLVTEVIDGHHKYQYTDQSTYTCQLCQEVYYGENVVAALDGELYQDIEKAFADAKPGDTLQLFADAEMTTVAVAGFTLDLNGYLLTADTFTSALSGDVIDTSEMSQGLLLCPDVTLADQNSYIPLNRTDGMHFCKLDFTQWVETVDENTTKVKFYFTQRAAQTIVDDAIKEGNRELGIQIKLTYTNAKGKKQTKTAVFNTELLKKYAMRWDGRVFVATIKGSGITKLTATYQVTSNVSSGTTLSAESIASAGYIQENLSWEQINSFELKRSDMTEEELRQAVVDFMYFTKTYLWTPSQTVKYEKNTNGSDDSMKQGTVYGGLPYVGVASGNVYRMMDYINEYGILDMEKALPATATKELLSMSDLKYFGSQCSISVYWAWGRIMNSAKYRWTYDTVPNNGFITLGDMYIPDIDKWTAAYNTTMCCHENGEEVMYNTYAQAKKADVLVYYIESTGGAGAGHLMMLYEDAHVVYNEDGTINGDESYYLIIDQGQSWKSNTNASGDKFSHKGNIALKKTFKQMYDYGYIPFTLAEYLGLDPIEETTVGLYNGETTYIDGVISETDRSYNTSVTTESLLWSEVFTGKVISNYGIADAYILLYDENGNEIYKHAVRVGQAGLKSMSLEESGAMVTTWGEKPVDGTYDAKIVVQLATGERPTIFAGQLTIDQIVEE